MSSVTAPIGGKSYFEVTATLNGPPASPYLVPIQFLYPVNPSESNGIAIVAFINNTAMCQRTVKTSHPRSLQNQPL